MEEVSATVPVKPFTGATVIVEVAAVPALTATVVGLALLRCELDYRWFQLRLLYRSLRWQKSKTA